MFDRLNSFFKSLGPGLITGASDDDPSGIATYSQAGAQFGFGMLWLALFQLPLMITIQEMCARIGLVTGGGLANIMKHRYSKSTVYPIIGLLLIANTINIGADIGAMSASITLVLPQIPIVAITILFSAFIVCMEIFISYRKYVTMLKYLTLSLLAYVVTAFIVGGNWKDIVVSSIVPHFEFTSEFVMLFVAIFGTTISPYLFFWQTSQEAEEDVAKNKISEIGKGMPKILKKEIKTMRKDVAIGMGLSQVIMWFIILTTAGTLHVHGLTDIATADDAAKSLEPLVKTFPHAGEIAKTIFALGIIGTGLLAIPVLAGSSAYALSEEFGWKEGLGKKFKQAKGFYLIIIASTVVGLWINFTDVDPIKALIYAAVINGIIAVPLLVFIMKIGSDRKILDGITNGKMSNSMGWITVGIMGFSVIVMFMTWAKLII
ncbi:Natural resistance-associated macrophage protein [Nitrosotalea sinensis]|uniref:Natural resistance-associated macrophage protein n=1 Tax=Nitrosotalea sinensis TaxID=1499975 RepID=A0A2H1EFW8_9ARCH|nr:divalent metal cation transporter [Candidatus Nitrosotalea sinensis]SHO44814.1 Natural resistance-associated macrophage protein [Candidatus Nitrosotalea sinensis]